MFSVLACGGGLPGGQSLLDFASVVATMLSLIELPEAPFENRKIHGFWEALEGDDQPASSYHLPVAGHPQTSSLT